MKKTKIYTLRLTPGIMCAFVLLLPFLILNTGSAYATGGTTVTVTKTADTNDGVCDADCSLREAIGSNAQNINFSSLFDSPQTITLATGALTITRDLNIDGPGPKLLSISGNNVHQVFNIAANVSVSLEGVAIINGNSFTGGGLHNAGTLTLLTCAVSENQAQFGGGIYNLGMLTIRGSTIDNNTAEYAGGLASEMGMTEIINSTISNNSVTKDGGGIDSKSRTVITSSTISENSAGLRGGGIDNNQGTVEVRNTIIANNTAGAASPDFEGPLTSLGFNLIENTEGINGNLGSDLTGQDPLLGPLADNGGPTRTHDLLSGSPAIDTGHSSGIAEDQRSLPRPFDFPEVAGAGNGDNSDIGSVEKQASAPAGATRFDLDGDFKTDIGIWRPGPGEWWYIGSRNGENTAFQFGQTGDVIIPADFTGDRATDIAFFRPSSGEWFVLRSEDSSFYSFPFGQNGDIPIPADYDGDGLADPAIFRPSAATWFILNSTGGTTIQQFGADGDVPIVLDYDGDGKDDLAVYRPAVSEWYYQRSGDGEVIGFQFGTVGDRPVPADFTGDGRADIAFFRPATGEWFILRSEDESFFAFPFGRNGDIPVPGDYDGDGRADPAIYRPTDTTWYLQQTTDGFAAVAFGIAGDRPIPAAYLP